MLICDRCKKEMRHDHNLSFQCSGWFEKGDIRAELCKDCHTEMETEVRNAYRKGVK